MPMNIRVDVPDLRSIIGAIRVRNWDAKFRSVANNPNIRKEIYKSIYDNYFTKPHTTPRDSGALQESPGRALFAGDKSDYGGGSYHYRLKDGTLKTGIRGGNRHRVASGSISVKGISWNPYEVTEHRDGSTTRHYYAKYTLGGGRWGGYDHPAQALTKLNPDVKKAVARIIIENFKESTYNE